MLTFTVVLSLLPLLDRELRHETQQTFINICNSMKSFSLAHDSVREKIDSVEWPSNAFLLGVFQSQYRELNLFYLKGEF